MKQIVVISGKGGTGKTSLVAALAAVGPAKALADCDVDAADLHLIARPEIRETHAFVSGARARIDPSLCTRCGLCREHCRFEAIDADCAVRPGHCEGCGTCAFVCPAGAVTLEPRSCGKWHVSETRFGPLVHAALAIGEENSGKLVTTVRRAARDEAERRGLPYVLVDGSPGIGCPVIASLTDTDLVLIVAEASLSALHDLKRVARLAGQLRIPALALLNKCDMNPAQAQAVRAYCRAEGLPLAGELPFDEAFVRAQLAGAAASEIDADIAERMRSLWEVLIQAAEGVLQGQAAS